MKLAEDKQVVEALKKILEDYDYLEYDEIMSGCGELLIIKVTDLSLNRGIEVPTEICRKLQEAINRKFSFSYDIDEDSDSFDDVLDRFYISFDDVLDRFYYP